VALFFSRCLSPRWMFRHLAPPVTRSSLFFFGGAKITIFFLGLSIVFPRFDSLALTAHLPHVLLDFLPGNIERSFSFSQETGNGGARFPLFPLLFDCPMRPRHHARAFSSWRVGFAFLSSLFFFLANRSKHGEGEGNFFYPTVTLIDPPFSFLFFGRCIWCRTGLPPGNNLFLPSFSCPWQFPVPQRRFSAVGAWSVTVFSSAFFPF